MSRCWKVMLANMAWFLIPTKPSPGRRSAGAAPDALLGNMSSNWPADRESNSNRSRNGLLYRCVTHQQRTGGFMSDEHKEVVVEKTGVNVAGIIAAIALL